MIKEFSFKNLRKYLEKDSNNKILEAFDKITEAAIIFSPVVFGIQFLPLLELLEVKNCLVSLGKSIVDYIASKKNPDYIKRFEQIQYAYSLICYTSYFEVLEEALPKEVVKKLKSHYKESAKLANSNPEVPAFSQELKDIHNFLPYTDHITSFSETKNNLLFLYQEISDKMIKIIKEANVILEDSDISEELKKSFDELPEKAVKKYQAQYLYLADTFSDFGFYVQEIEFGTLQNAVKVNSETLNLIASATKEIDVGLSNLCNIVNSMQFGYTEIQSQEIVNDLQKKYKAMIEQPIIDDKEISSDEEKIRLTFPKIKDAFIPQSYKCLSYQSQTKLEDEKTWKEVETRDDLNYFFIRYLCSPDSIDTPLIILGHPGSGKSLLTKVLSAQLMSDTYTAIRIPLREVNADSTIDLLVEDQIKKVTQLNMPQGGYGAFAKQFKEKPLLIILDGYDELLQAKGDVFASYLDKAMRFQQDQKDLNRPVRVIVTSRITLIDKAIVPLNSTVLRLLEFNENQRNKWIEIWNQANAGYFQSCTPMIKPFALPSTKQNSGTKENNSILELAEQPLLLLMLALYDSEGNSLSELDNDLKRTVLYNNLLRRFVRRERGRYVLNFNEKTQHEQNELIDIEMKRLGIVAIGMFNRRKLYINTKELENDLKVFKSGRKPEEMSGRKLKDSESLLGGFFFIHQSTAQDVSANSDNADSAFEFLHNTFDEFLTADIILRFAINEVQAIGECRKNKFLENELHKKLNSPDGLCKEWFTCLMFTPLFSRPVILEMIGEHIAEALSEKKIEEDYFYENFEIVIKSQLKMILSTLTFPSAMTDDHGITSDIPILGYASIYTLNLIILASVLCKNGFVFDEDEYSRQDAKSSETKPWDKLTFLWKTWFSAENLTGIFTVFNAKRDGNKIFIKCHDKFEADSLSKPIDIQLCVSYALSDILNTGLAGLQSTSFSKIVALSQQQIAELLKKENMDLYFAFMTISLRDYIYSDIWHESNGAYIPTINNLVEKVIQNVEPHNTNTQTLLAFFETADFCIKRSALYSNTKKALNKFVLGFLDVVTISRGAFPAIYSAQRLLNRIAYNNNLAVVDEMYMLDNPVITQFRDFEIDFLADVPHYIPFHRIIMFDFKELINEIIDNAYIDSEEKDRILHKLISHENICDLAHTDPAFVTKTLLHLPSVIKENHQIVGRVIDIILKEVTANLFEFVEPEAIINIIRLSELVPHKISKEKISTVLTRAISRHPHDKMNYRFYGNPELINALIDVLLASVADEIIDFSFAGRYMFGKTRKLPSQKTILSYIKLIRKLVESNSLRSHTPFLFEDFDRMITIQVVEQIFTNNKEKHTLEDLKALYWFARWKDNNRLCNKIKAICDFIK